MKRVNKKSLRSIAFGVAALGLTGCGGKDDQLYDMTYNQKVLLQGSSQTCAHSLTYDQALMNYMSTGSSCGPYVSSD